MARSLGDSIWRRLFTIGAFSFLVQFMVSHGVFTMILGEAPGLTAMDPNEVRPFRF